MRERLDLGGVAIACDVDGLALFRENNRNVEILRGQAGDTDARCLDGQNFRDLLVGEATLELLADLAHKAHVDLVVDEAVDLEHVALKNLALFEYLFLQKLHLFCPFARKIKLLFLFC